MALPKPTLALETTGIIILLAFFSSILKEENQNQHLSATTTHRLPISPISRKIVRNLSSVLLDNHKTSVSVTSILLRFDVANVNSAQEIQLTNQLNESLPFNFNAQTKKSRSVGESLARSQQIYNYGNNCVWIPRSNRFR